MTKKKNCSKGILVFLVVLGILEFFFFFFLRNQYGIFITWTLNFCQVIQNWLHHSGCLLTIFEVHTRILELGDLDKINDTWSNWVTSSNPINIDANWV